MKDLPTSKKPLVIGTPVIHGDDEATARLWMGESYEGSTVEKRIQAQRGPNVIHVPFGRRNG